MDLNAASERTQNKQYYFSVKSVEKSLVEKLRIFLLSFNTERLTGFREKSE